MTQPMPITESFIIQLQQLRLAHEDDSSSYNALTHTRLHKTVVGGGAHKCSAAKGCQSQRQRHRTGTYLSRTQT